MAEEVVLPKPSFSIWHRMFRFWLHAMMLQYRTSQECADRTNIMFIDYALALRNYIDSKNEDKKAELQEVADARNNIEAILFALTPPPHKRVMLMEAADREYKLISLEKKIGIPHLK